MSDYGKKIQSLRKEKGITQSELGEMLNVSSQAVSKWENGLAEPDLETIKKMCKYFAITVDSFLAVNEEESETQEIETPVQNQVMPSYVCSKCGKLLYENEYKTYKGKTLCDNCLSLIQKEEKEKAEQLAREKVREERLKKEQERISIAEDSRKFAKSLIIPAIIITVIALIVYLSVRNEEFFTTEYLIGFIISVLLIYITVPQIIWGVGPIPSIFVFTFKRSFSMPGVIFDFSIDGIITGLLIKLALSILAILLSIFVSILGFMLCMVIAPFSFVPCLIYIINNKQELY